jgi:hypothetical protein
MTKDEALTLEALKYAASKGYGLRDMKIAPFTIKGNEALAQPAQEPVAWMVYTQDGKSVYVTDNPTDIPEGQRALPLYTAPVQRTWVGIPEEDLKQGDESFFVAWREGARWADAYLKEKNNG